MHAFTITLFIINMVISHENDYYKKCCKSGEYLEENNASYKCVENKSRRWEILTNETNFLEDNFDGECVDTDKDFFTFKIIDGKVIKKLPIVEKYFPKCCPLNYRYNSILHSCEQVEDMELDFIQENFIKVGLPDCKIIVDHIFNNGTDYNYEITETGNMLSNNLASYCVDKTETYSFVLRECKENLQVCEHIKCIKKCCPDGQSFINRSKCFDTYRHGLNLSSFSAVENPTDPYVIISDRTCPKIYMMPEKQYEFHLDNRGVFKYWQENSKSFMQDEVDNLTSYCIEHTKTKSFNGYLFFMCFPKRVVSEKFLYTVWPKILSCILLFLTIIVYLVLTETRNVFGKILVNYCSALLFENGILTYAQVSLYPTTIDCILRCFFIIFFATAAFTWSNVVCYDIWRTFGSTKRTFGEISRNKTIKKLLLYFIYGWGLPTFLTLTIYLLYNYKVLPYSLQPLLAEKKCFFDTKDGNYAQGLFFNLPHLIMQLFNTVLFVKTTHYCLKVKNEINKINETARDDNNKNFQKDKERLFLILKLSVIMGVSFIFEVVSAFFNMKEMGEVPKYIEIVWDMVNCLQGVFIFIIFVCKKKICRDLLRKFSMLVSRTSSSSSFHTQSTTTSTGISTKVINTDKEKGKPKI